MDSTGLDVLLAVATATGTSGNRLRITRLSAPVQRARGDRSGGHLPPGRV